MATSRIPGILNARGPWVAARTPGVLGYGDQADPNMCSLLGDSPGVLGFQDYADPTLPWLKGGERNVSGSFGRASDGSALSLPASQQVPQAASPTWKLTAEQLLKIFPSASKEYMKQVADELNTDLPKYGLDSSLRCAHFFAQTREEGGAALTARVESLNYGEEGLKSTFKYYREHPTEAKDDAYWRDAKTRKITRHAEEEKIGNKVYASRNGNGDSASGDGWKFRGRGLIQVTGRVNYKAAAAQYGKLYGDAVDFEADPDKMEDFPYTVRSAVCFWIEHGLQDLADKGETDANVDSITQVINLNTDSYANRRANFKTANDAFKA